MQATQELPIRDMSPLLPPRALKAELPMTEVAHRTVVEGRATIRRILRREDHRLLVIVGPCSIHDPEAALEDLPPASMPCARNSSTASA